MHSVELLEKIVGVKTSLTPIDGLIPVNAAVDDIISKNRSFDYLLGHSDTDKALVHQ